MSATDTPTCESVDLDRVHTDGMTYAEYQARWEAQRTADLPDDADASDRRMMHYLNYNHERQASVHEAYTVSEELQDALDAAEMPQTWMVLTEPWCGDSAFILPVIAEAAQAHPDIDLRILLRDDNLDLMDRFLTGGSRSIPKLVGLDDDGTVLFTWGPRPEEAQDRYDALNASGKDKMAIVKALLDWYDEGGWQHVERELIDTLYAATPSAP
jgi:hypothetical protein